MRLRSLFRISLILLAAGVSFGCDQGRKAQPETTVRVVHAAPSYGTIVFRREEFDAPVELNYKGTSGRLTYDQDQYDFHIEVTKPGAANADRVHSISKEVLAGTQYTFVLTEVGGTIQPVILEYPALESTSTQTQILALHAGTTLPAMDVYIEPAGTVVATAIPEATLAFGQSFAPVLMAAGDYEITLTEPGNPANVLLASSSFPLAAALPTVFVIVDGAEEGVAPLQVAVMQDSSGVLLDKNLQSALRILNGATDMGARDVAINGQFTPPLFAAVPFAIESGYAPIPPGDNTVDVTPAGNPGVLELTQTISAPIGAKQTLLITGDAGTLTHQLVTDDQRRITAPDYAEARLRFFNVARQFTAVDFLIVETGTDATSLAPTATLAAPGATSIIGFIPGTYEVVLRQSGTTTLLGSPVPITMNGGGIYSILATNGTDSMTANAVLLDDF